MRVPTLFNSSMQAIVNSMMKNNQNNAFKLYSQIQELPLPGMVKEHVKELVQLHVTYGKINTRVYFKDFFNLKLNVKYLKALRGVRISNAEYVGYIIDIHDNEKRDFVSHVVDAGSEIECLIFRG